MNQPISTAGRVCLCEWAGPVTVAMIVSLLSHLKRAREEKSGSVLLMLHVTATSAKSMTRTPNPFLDGLPAIFDCCKEVTVVVDADGANGLRRAIYNQLAPTAQKRVTFFELLDDAFTHAQNECPHEVLELRRRRIRSGAWPILGALCLVADGKA